MQCIIFLTSAVMCINSTAATGAIACQKNTVTFIYLQTIRNQVWKQASGTQVSNRQRFTHKSCHTDLKIQMKILPHYPTVLPQYIQILGINFQQNFPTDMMLKTICKSPEKQETEELNYFCLNLIITKRVYNNYFSCSAHRAS